MTLDEQFKHSDVLRRYAFGVAIALFAAGLVALATILFGRQLLPPVIDIVPERIALFDGPVCPGEISKGRVFTYYINRPSVMDIDVTLYDKNTKRPVPAMIATPGPPIPDQPSPYVMQQTRPLTIPAPNLPPGLYEYQLSVTAKGENARPAFWFLEFQIAENCPDPEGAPPTPTPGATP